MRTLVPITSIKVSPTRNRRLRDVSALAKSIDDVGLLQPIVVTHDLVLVAGLHRLKACESLGWKTVPVTIIDLQGLRAVLAEIDENFVRHDLTVLERAECIARRKEIYENLHPATAAWSSDRQRARANGKPSEMISPGFAEDTAGKTGLSARTIQQEVQIAEKITPETKELIRGTETADSKVKLLAIARLPADEQMVAVAASRPSRPRTRIDLPLCVRRGRTKQIAIALVARLPRAKIRTLIRELDRLVPAEDPSARQEHRP